MITFGRNMYDFPQQKVPASVKRKAEWYANCIDFIIDAGISMNNMKDIENKINILHGDVPDEFYRKTLNPYNSSKEKYTRFPATMRNLDIMSDVIRRYVGEYTKGVHDFTVGSNDPNFVINKQLKLKEEVTKLCEEAFRQEFERRLQEMQAQMQQQQAQAQEQGQPAAPNQQINPNEVMSQEEIEQFIKDFNDKYIDEKTIEGQQTLEYIQSITKDEEIYAQAYFNFCAYGRCFTYSNINETGIHKENIPVIEAYPIPNREPYIEDQDMFARCMKMSKHQILDYFDEYLTKEDRAFFDSFYAHEGQKTPNLLSYDQYFEHYPDVCSKFSEQDRNQFKASPVTVYADNGMLYDVWHVVWKGFVRKGILTYINELGMPAQEIVDEDFQFNAELGHINIEWTYVPQVYEGYRIGSRYTAVYPIKARPIYSNNGDKLPYNGLLEPIPLMGPFSIVEVITPFQIMRNIFSYHREMVIAKNKMLILILPESLLGGDPDSEEDKIYKMAADGVLVYDDSVDSNSIKAQQIRMLNANLNDYVRQLTELIESIKVEAREQVDMTQQRYGMIQTSAGKGTTEEAIARGSMGSVTINFAFDKYRCTDYQRDLNNAKLAWPEGIEDAYWDKEGNRRAISLSSDSVLYNDYSIMVKNSAKETEKLEQLRQWAFSAAQNGDLDMALAAITGNNINVIKNTVLKFQEIKRQHEQQMQEAENLIKQEEIENKLREIAAKGEEDRKTLELKYYYEMQKAYVDADVSILGDPDTTAQDKNASAERIAEGQREIERQKLQLEREKLISDNYNAAADRNLQREQMQNDLKIARTNKNKYDKK